MLTLPLGSQFDYIAVEVRNSFDPTDFRAYDTVVGYYVSRAVTADNVIVRCFSAARIRWAD